MLEEAGRVLGRLVGRAPLLSSVVIISVLALVSYRCSFGADEAARNRDAVVEHQRRQAVDALQRVATEAARIEAAKSPEQLASEATAKVEAVARAERLAAKAQDAEAKREAAITKLMAGMERLKWWQLCARWGREHRKQMGSPAADAAYRLLKQQGLINNQDEMVVGVRERLPAVGMTGCGAVAILGAHDDSNVSTNAYGTSVQMVYRDRGIYVYTKGPVGDHNGVITSIQY